jgi:predicted N-acyltransferase
VAAALPTAVPLSIRAVTQVGDLDPAAWDALDHGPSPFLRWAFLTAMERSGSIGAASGWQPVIVLAEVTGVESSVEHAETSTTPSRRLLGAIVAFLKTHSYGEYIFDWAWARAASGAGIRYYPKLVIAAPLTPATGRRLLLAPDLDAPARAETTSALLAGIREVADDTRASSIHWLFVTPDERETLVDAGYLGRTTFQFHWRNEGYADFDAYLERMTSRKRKQIRKERARARAGIDEIVLRCGDELGPSQLAAMDRFYRTTVERHGGMDYLRPGFFDALVELAPEMVRFADVLQAGETVAGALFLESDAGLYGRYWGSDIEAPMLHFETAYYVGIEHCIARGIPLFEAGAQGEHKLLRGFLPAATHSAHWLRHEGLRDGVSRFLQHEERAAAQQMAALAEYGPFKHDGAGDDA